MDVEQNHARQKHRGKLYALSDESSWEDTGTGFASVVVSGDQRRLIFREEETSDILHDRPVFDRSVYQLQGEGERQTIIVWEDAGTQKDWALSFQDPDGTQEIWEAICGDVEVDEKRVMPLPTLATLGELSRKLTCVPPSLREILANECMSPKFISGLRETFHTAEDVVSEEALALLWQITKSIFLLSNVKLTERYLKKDVYEDVFGMLEHDAGLPASKRITHRHVLKNQVQFKHVLAFEDAETIERIHLNYRLQYLKDIALPRVLDDGAAVSLTQMIHINLTIIIDVLQRSPKLIEQLFDQIRQKDWQSLCFLQDVCRLARQIAPNDRQALHERMVALNCFGALVPFLNGGTHCIGEPGADSRGLCDACVEVLLLSVQNDPAHLRCFLVLKDNSESKTLLSSLARIVHYGENQGVQGQAAELLKGVMEVGLLESRERDACMDAFYDDHALDDLTSPLRSDVTAQRQNFSPCVLFGLQLACELLAFAVMQHGYRARVYVIRHGIIQHTMRLLGAPQRFLQLAPVRLLHAIVASKDDAYHRYVIKCGCFAHLFRAFEDSVRPPAFGGNLLISAALQLLEYIRIENIKSLVDHICIKHGDLLREHESKIRVLHLLLLKHQQNLEYEAFPPEQHTNGGPIASGSNRGSGTSRSSRMRSPGREDSDDDEAYFESLDDDDDEDYASAHQSPSSARAAEETSSNGSGTPGEVSNSHGAQPPNGVTSESPPTTEAQTSANGLQGLLQGYADDDEKDATATHADAEGATPNGVDAPVAGPQLEDESTCDGMNAQTAHDASCDGMGALPAPQDGEDVANATGQGATSRANSPQPERVPLSACAADAVEHEHPVPGEQLLSHAPKRLKTSAAAVETQA